eukprot:gnl/TRDRNA2_/TRDRNA2_163309_c2_seq3.p1 gnl/TRDRNA2_/TRDRNA2_163309_c2~~gnl/TRDRNA2_/TRDRNA2_163309_c2_seq3.p1  ORF type:complete len:297 (-),score=26.60 gnl/TRDRNA2_/TRDRNA2_163309_c2_seq3:223-1113(-)
MAGRLALAAQGVPQLADESESESSSARLSCAASASAAVAASCLLNSVHGVSSLASSSKTRCNSASLASSTALASLPACTEAGKFFLRRFELGPPICKFLNSCGCCGVDLQPPCGKPPTEVSELDDDLLALAASTGGAAPKPRPPPPDKSALLPRRPLPAVLLGRSRFPRTMQLPMSVPSPASVVSLPASIVLFAAADVPHFTPAPGAGAAHDATNDLQPLEAVLSTCELLADGDALLPLICAPPVAPAPTAPARKPTKSATSPSRGAHAVTPSSRTSRCNRRCAGGRRPPSAARIF